MWMQHMGNELTVTRAGDVGRVLQSAEVFIARWKEGKNAETLRAYAGDLAHFAGWLMQHLETPLDEAGAVNALFAMGQGEANETVHAYRNRLLAGGLAPATVNRRLNALRSIVSTGQQFGYVPWTLNVDSVASRKYRDTRGVPASDVVRVLEHVRKHPRLSTAARDVAIVTLLFVIGLRISEVLGLDLEHVDVRGGRLSILGKARTEREWVTIPPLVQRVLKAWLTHRGRTPGALFVKINRHGQLSDGRLTGPGVRDCMQRWGDELELVLRPHGFRHSAVTTLLDMTNGDIRSASKFARHSSIEVTAIYDDNRQDTAGASAGILAKRVAGVLEGLE